MRVGYCDLENAKSVTAGQSGVRLIVVSTVSASVSE